jgi:hypothetical protein
MLNLLDVNCEALPVDRAIENPRRLDPIVAQCGQEGCGFPVSVRDQRIGGGSLETRFCSVEFSMLRSNWTPSIVPRGDDQNVYLVMDDLGRLGRVWREADDSAADLEAVILDLLAGQYNNPVRVVSFNTAEKWSQDVSADVAQELRRRCDLQQLDIPFFLQDFVDRYEGRYSDIQFPLPIRLV